MAGGNLAAQRPARKPRTAARAALDEKDERAAQTHEWLKKATDILQGQLQPILPAASPVVVGADRGGHKVPVVICRTWRGIEAKDVKTGARVWRIRLPPGAWT